MNNFIKICIYFYILAFTIKCIDVELIYDKNYTVIKNSSISHNFKYEDSNCCDSISSFYVFNNNITKFVFNNYVNLNTNQNYTTSKLNNTAN
jgi:hypothetical protein